MTAVVAFPDREPDRPTPEADDAERSVLGASLLWPEALQAARESGLSAAQFRLPQGVAIWQAIEALWATGQPIDALTVKGELIRRDRFVASGGDAELARLIDSVPRRTHVAYYAALVQTAARARVLQALAYSLYRQASVGTASVDELIAQTERHLRVLASGQPSAVLADGPMLAQQVCARLEHAMAHRDTVTGLSTGFVDLDRLTTGWHPGELVIIAGRPGMGKTSFAGATAWAAATHGCPTLFASIEMTAADVALRLACLDARVSFTGARGGQLGPDDLARLMRTMARLEASALYLEDTSRTVRDVRRQARVVAAKAGRCGLIVVDYLQLLRPPPDSPRRASSETRTREIGEMTGDLKALAKDLACPVLLLSQLNRACETRGDKRPMLSDLRDSGEIEQDADVVAFLWQGARYGLGPDGMAEVILAKQRNGPCATQQLAWTGDCMRYDDLYAVRS